jgi:alpha-1,3-glucan synthase
MWAIGLVLYFGLPSYYRQTPGNTPSFYRSILKRKIILWFLLAVVLQNLFMSAPTGRNWTYLWSSQHAPDWAVLLLVLLFFVVVWAGLLLVFAHLSATHSWILPVFGVGLGAPRWAQMLWGVSGIGAWVPWAGGSYVASALVGRVLWLWLGVMDVIQGVGFGMILLQTLTRLHMTFALIAAQVIGSVATIVARACVSDNVGPGDVFPNMLIGRWMDGAMPGDWGWGYGLGRPWFWIGLLCQLVIPIGFLMFFRKEQLSKP